VENLQQKNNLNKKKLNKSKIKLEIHNIIFKLMNLYVLEHIKLNNKMTNVNLKFKYLPN
jgi:hypothetical protein